MLVAHRQQIQTLKQATTKCSKTKLKSKERSNQTAAATAITRTTASATATTTTTQQQQQQQQQRHCNSPKSVALFCGCINWSIGSDVDNSFNSKILSFGRQEAISSLFLFVDNIVQTISYLGALAGPGASQSALIST
ncbi:hypothetical protein PoB_004934300 [Plakobranchus ocellatus]|uniref:Uncharacterized protein n=1 Tax=Plakobranchus ocellatus TaxID=259542 RepID=A0AAV4BTB7_9GAST|nr:hypothetical protein PoB_004934300 [Plakobranchus ocellatus]